MVVAIIAVMFGGGIAAGIVIAVAEGLAFGGRVISNDFMKNAGSATTAGIEACSYLATVPVTLLVLQYLGGPPFFRGLFRALRWRDIVTVAVAVIASLIFDECYSRGLAALGQGGHKQAGFEVFHASSWTDRIVDLVAICIVGPVAEELIFRGLLLGAFECWFGLVPGVITSSLLFGLAHGDVVLFGELFASGLILAIVFKRTTTLYASMAVHATNNVLVTLALFATQ